jgi:hypothetical protein
VLSLSKFDRIVGRFNLAEGFRMLPRHRDQGLLIERVSDETIVYDTTRHDAHCLNRVSSLVWQHCDGRTSPAEMVELLRTELGLAADESTVGLVLEQLAEANLLVEERSARSATAAYRSRRQVAKQLAAIGLSGVVISLAVPTPAAAASLLPLGASCTGDTQCASGICNTHCFVCCTTNGSSGCGTAMCGQ